MGNYHHQRNQCRPARDGMERRDSAAQADRVDRGTRLARIAEAREIDRGIHEATGMILLVMNPESYVGDGCFVGCARIPDLTPLAIFAIAVYALCYVVISGIFAAIKWWRT